MIISGEEIIKYGILKGGLREDSLTNKPNINIIAIQPNSVDIRLCGVFETVELPLGEKIHRSELKEVKTVPIGTDEYYKLQYNSYYLFKTPIIDLRSTSDFWKYQKVCIINDDNNVAQYCEKYNFCGEVIIKSSWALRGWQMFPNHWDTGFNDSGFVLIKTPDKPIDSMTNYIYVHKNSYFAQLRVYVSSPTGNYVKNMGV